MLAEDAGAVVAMARELALSVADPPPALDAERLVRDAYGAERWFECFVAEHDGVLVGYVLACRGFEAHTGKRRLWMGDLFIREKARRLGAGKMLIAAIAKHALALGCDAVYWELWRLNATGKAFYDRLVAEEATDLAIMRFDRARLMELATQIE